MDELPERISTAETLRVVLMVRSAPMYAHGVNCGDHPA